MKKLIRRILLASLVGTMVLGVTAVQAGTIKVGITGNCRKGDFEHDAMIKNGADVIPPRAVKQCFGRKCPLDPKCAD